MSDQQKAENGMGRKVPEGWESRSFGELAEFRNGLNFVQADTGESVKIIGVSDFQQRRTFSNIESLKEINVKEKLRSDDILRRDDLLFVRSNGNKDLIGRCMVIAFDEVEKVSFSGFTIRARFKKPVLLPLITADLFTTSQVKRQIAEAGGGTNIANLSQDILAKIKLPVPPLPEQHKIASILSEWDNSLSILAKLIEAKRQQKRGLAEQLLTGKKRLPGFQGEWDSKKLGEVFHLLIGGTPSRSNPDYWDVEKKTDNIWLAISDLKGKYVSESKERISNKGVKKSNVKLIPENTVVMSFKLTLGRAAITTTPLYTNEAICAFIPMQDDIVDTEYFYQSVAVMDFTEGVDIAVKGATMNKEKLTNFFFLLPPLPEQQAIASVLSTLDAEISALSSLKTSLLAQKRGLMDVLLTGRVRVKVSK